MPAALLRGCFGGGSVGRTPRVEPGRSRTREQLSSYLPVTALSMAGLIDSTLDELETHLRELKRVVSRLEAFRRQLLDAAEDEPATVAKQRVRSSSFSSPSA